MEYQVQDCIGTRLRALSRKVDGIYRKYLKGTGITENQLSILLALNKTGETEQNTISSILNLERSSMSRNLTRLIEQKLVAKRGPVNRPMIRLTSKGQSKVQSLFPLWNLAMNEIHHLLDFKSIEGIYKLDKKLK